MKEQKHPNVKVQKYCVNKYCINKARNTASIKRVNGRGETVRDCKDGGGDSAFFEFCSKVEGETRRVKLPSAIGRSRAVWCARMVKVSVIVFVFVFVFMTGV